MQGEEKSNEGGQISQQPAPGATISPNTAAPSSSEQPVAANEKPQAPGPTVSDVPVNQSASQVSTPQDFNEMNLSWIGPEFISHDKSSLWYMSCLGMAVVLSGIVYLIVRDLVSAISIFLAVIILGFYSIRKPKNVNYTLNETGIAIGQKSFFYEEFKSFTASREGPYLSINLLPIKRFSPPAGLCYQGQDEDRLVSFLSDRLPMQQYKPDILDSLLLRIRF